MEGRVEFQGPNMEGQWQLLPWKLQGSHREKWEDGKEGSGHLGKRKKKAKLLASVGRKKEEDIRNKSNDLEIKKLASKRKLLRTLWVELPVRSGELWTQDMWSQAQWDDLGEHSSVTDREEWVIEVEPDQAESGAVWTCRRHSGQRVSLPETRAVQWWWTTSSRLRSGQGKKTLGSPLRGLLFWGCAFYPEKFKVLVNTDSGIDIES